MITDIERKQNKLQPDPVKDTIALKTTPLLQRVTEMCWPHREIENRSHLCALVFLFLIFQGRKSALCHIPL